MSPSNLSYREIFPKCSKTSVLFSTNNIGFNTCGFPDLKFIAIVRAEEFRANQNTNIQMVLVLGISFGISGNQFCVF